VGFSVTASGIIVVGLLLVISSILVAHILMAGKTSIFGLERKTEKVWNKMGSIMQIKNPALQSDNRTLTFLFSNNGTVTFWDFEKFDLIVSYTDRSTGARKVVLLRYGEDWNITRIIINGGYTITFRQGDDIEPSETGEVVALLPTQADRSLPIKIELVNQYGGKTSYKFVG